MHAQWHCASQFRLKIECMPPLYSVVVATVPSDTKDDANCIATSSNVVERRSTIRVPYRAAAVSGQQKQTLQDDLSFACWALKAQPRPATTCRCRYGAFNAHTWYRQCPSVPSSRVPTRARVACLLRFVAFYPFAIPALASVPPPCSFPRRSMGVMPIFAHILYNASQCVSPHPLPAAPIHTPFSLCPPSCQQASTCFLIIAMLHFGYVACPCQ